MKYNIKTIPKFDKQAKALAKKYPSFKKDLSELVDVLSENPHAGVLLFENVYKIRMNITCKKRGKSGGARVIYVNLFERVLNDELVLIAIYDKSERSTMTDKEIIEVIKSAM
ncbi:MAG: addiction module toxin RelE [Paludibacteraceae bacterium]|jgi:mRNA-degrading endonuclease RelE of RelBE toxin-antitoxin system|nr:addiction module toxin RelE [Paludibacteraceae bacterium]MBP5480679.1 addiction module toxin RelE [Paludibacteraceae bacterium]MBR3518580.1 addiction module toxin RelE [Paludibacteraceae bacterium]